MWRFDDFIVLQGLGLQHLELAKTVYADHHNWLGVARFEILFFVLYIIFIFGTMILGLFQTKKTLSLFPRELNIFLLSGFGVSAFLGFFFIQQTGGANSSQFLITINILGSLYAALACYYWIGKFTHPLKYIVIFLVVLLTVPRVLTTAWSQMTQLQHNRTFLIDNSQLEALNYLKTGTPQSSIILVNNFVSSTNQWRGFSYYISFLANRSLFIDGDASTNSIVDSHGVDTTQRVIDAKAVFADMTSSKAKEILYKNKIAYLYVGTDKKMLKRPPKFLKPVYTNAEISIYKVI